MKVNDFTELEFLVRQKNNKKLYKFIAISIIEFFQNMFLHNEVDKIMNYLFLNLIFVLTPLKNQAMEYLMRFLRTKLFILLNFV